MSTETPQPSVLLAAMADGIGDLAFASPQWVDAAREALTSAVGRYAAGLASLGAFTLCEVAHNSPAYLHCGSKLAWHAVFDGALVEVHSGELPASACDLKVEGDHSIMSNLARIQYAGRDPKLVAAAQARLHKLSRWVVHGSIPTNPVLAAVLRSLHDALAVRTLPRFVFMTPEWVSCARHILTMRAALTKYADGLSDVEYTFAEQFTQTPQYAFPDGSDGGFWVRCSYGQITVGAGPLPKELNPLTC